MCDSLAMPAPSPRRLLVAALAAVVLPGCGAGVERSQAPPAAIERAALDGSPSALAALHREASRLLPGGASAVTARLRALRGYPVVVNAWAAWCGPCRHELPVFQRASVKLGRRIAFLGVDTQDEDAAAREMMKGLPVSYPSYADPAGDVLKGLGAAGLPVTAFYDRRGRLAYLHQGPYAGAGDLAQDVRRYLGA